MSVIDPLDTEEQELDKINFFNSIYNVIKYKNIEPTDKIVAEKLLHKARQAWSKRDDRVESSMHEISRFIIEYCKHRKIGTLVIGYNEGWKQGARLGHETQEKFMKIPFAKLKQKILYKARLSGIDAFINEESHTSKCSALDNESIEHHDRYIGLRGPSMKRSKVKHYFGRDGSIRTTNHYQARGLLRTPRTEKLMKEKLINTGVGFEYIHSDVNGALNIGRKGAPEYFNDIGKREMKLSPIFVKNMSIEGARAIYNTS